MRLPTPNRLAGAVAAILVASLVANEVTVADAAGPPAGNPRVVADSPVDAGRYLVIVGGCNDCHTAGYLESEGNVAEQDWLAGAPIGWRGPWGTTYASNLRLLVSEISEDAWVAMLATRKALPPMPWMNLNRLHADDARAMYRYIRALGPTGEAMPAPLPPGTEPETPYFLLEPTEPRPRPAAPAAFGVQD